MRRLLLSLVFFAFLNITSNASAVPPKGADTTGAAEIKSQHIIQVGYFVSTPHIFFDKETKKISGAVYDLLEKYIGPRINIKFNWDPFPTTIPRQLINIKSSRYYMASFLAYVPSRESFGIHSSQPIYYAHSNIAVLMDHPLREITSVKDLKNMVIGYAQNAYISPFMRDPSIKFDFVATPDYHTINIQKVLLGRIDGVYAPGRGSVLVELQRLGNSDQFRQINLPEPPVACHFLFSKDLVDVVEKYNEAMDKMGGLSLYLKLLSNYVDVSKM